MFIKQESSSSRQKHISNGMKYFKEQYIHAMTGGFYNLIVELYCFALGQQSEFTSKTVTKTT